MLPRADRMEIPDFGEICLNVEASKVSAAFSQVTDALRYLNEKQQTLASQLAALSEKVAGTEELQKQLAALEEKSEKSTEELKAYGRELEGLKLGEQTKTIELHSQQFEKTLTLLEQSDLKWKEHEAKLAQMGIDSRQSSSALQKMATDVSSLRNTVEAHTKTVGGIQAGHAECIERCSQVEESQHRLQESVSSKYQKLWQEVVGALEKVNAVELSNYQTELRKSAHQSEQRVRQLVTYAVNLVAQAARERRNDDLKRAVILKWKEAAWLGARRRMACRLLHHLFRSHCRKHFRTVQQVTAWESHISRVKKEFQDCLPDLDGVLKRLVQPAVSTMEEKSAASENLTQQLQEQVEQLAAHTRGLQDATSSLSSKAESTFQSIEQLHGEFEQVLSRSSTDKERVDEFETQLKEIVEQMSQVARHDEMQGIMKDILLIWTAVKQIDATKADKRDLDSLATETSTRGQNTELKLKHLESFWSEQHQTLQGQLSGAEENMNDINNRNQTLNFTLGVLMRFMEDIVKKILSIESKGSTIQCSQTGRGGIVVRTGGGWIAPPLATSGVYSSAPSRPASPCCPAVSSSLTPAENSSLMLGSGTGKPEQQIGTVGMTKPIGRCRQALPAQRTNFENLRAITLQETHDNKRATGGLEGDNSTGASNWTDNPAVRTFCDWVEQVRAAFEAPSTPGACAGQVTAPDAPPESAVSSARAPPRQRTPQLEVRGNEAHTPRGFSQRPGTAGPGMHTTMKRQWRHKVQVGCDKASNRSSSGGYSPTLKSNRPMRATSSCRAWGIFN